MKPGKPQRGENQTGDDLLTLLLAKASENSEITTETSRVFNSEIFSHISRKLEEVKLHLNTHILQEINSAIEEKVL